MDEIDPKVRGGLARAESLTPAKRSEIAQKAAQARWGEDVPKAINEGTIALNIGEAKIAIPCAVLENGKRVLTQSGFMKALGRARQAKGRAYYDGDVNTPAFLTAKNLQPFIPNELRVTSSQITFKPLGAGNRAFGYPAELLPQVCEVFLKARDAGALTGGQSHICQQADILMRGLAHVGIIALVDEATGYQADRAKDALAKILEKFISKELCKWVKTFPDEFYEQLFRLRGLTYNQFSTKRPVIIGKITKDIVYERLGPGVLDALREKNPRKPDGRLKDRDHQWLTPELGRQKLREQLSGEIALMTISDSYEKFYAMLNRVYPKQTLQLEIPAVRDIPYDAELR